MEDKEIVKLYFNREEAAICETKNKYGNTLFCTAYNMLGCREDAEECENDTYWAAWKSIPPCEPKALLAYLMKINRGRVLDKWDHRSAQKRNGAVFELEQYMTDNESVRQRIEYDFDRQRITKLFNDFLCELTPEKRIIFIKRYWYGESIGKISMEMCMTPGMVKMKLHRLKGKLRDQIQREETK